MTKISSVSSGVIDMLANATIAEQESGDQSAGVATDEAPTPSVVVNLSEEARASLNTALAAEVEKVTTPSAAIDLRREAEAWFTLQSTAIHEKAKIEASRWSPGGMNDLASLYSGSGQGSAATQREAYVQLRLVGEDEGRALGEAYQLFQYALDNNIPISQVNPADVPRGSYTPRENVEVGTRALMFSGPIYMSSVSAVTPDMGNMSEATPVVRPSVQTKQDMAALTHAEVVKLRQKMGADPEASYEVNYFNNGPLITDKMTASARQAILDAQAAYDRLLVERLNAEAGGSTQVAASTESSSPSGSEAKAAP